ncbi:MAG: ADP-glyceromanno-heptose 6-epimerase [Bacteroidetes bacterium CG2_30_33_31]|nr:MAG: ADP-glyceromanno-heptose 6-epimerase [Bacteroidetes bacterium CG2_30_33_31]
MIIVTGALGFIGSVLVGALNKKGYKNLILVDDFSKENKFQNLENKSFSKKIERDIFQNWLNNTNEKIDFVIHIGARTDTTEFDVEIFNKLNLNFTKDLWVSCSKKNIPLIYASSAATYGGGEWGYEDNHEVIYKLKPLNPYGESKNDFDKWALQQKLTPPFWSGLKFFNVYGPNEYHKGRMASVIFHAFNQINKTGGMKLFRSHNTAFKDGEQLRDFVYVKDVVNVIIWLMEKKPQSALFNLGTGKARSFLDLAKNTFIALGKPENISFIDTPEDIREKYQYFTQANMNKLISAGYNQKFYSLEQGIDDYVKYYLLNNKNY